ncbi:hypothetical protein BGZ58_003869, partial [Dissophora ornata]
DPSDPDSSIEIPVGIDSHNYDGFFVPETSQLGLMSNGVLSLWKLSVEKNQPILQLSLIWKYQKVPEGMELIDICVREATMISSCVHGKNLKINLSPCEWYRYGFEIDVPNTIANTKTAPNCAADNSKAPSSAVDARTASIYNVNLQVSPDSAKDGEDILTVPISNDDTLSAATEEYRLNQGFAILIETYALGNDHCRDAIIRYLKVHVRRSRERRSVSPLYRICEAWTDERGSFIDEIIAKLLPYNHITWVPDTDVKNDDNPLSIILDTAETYACALGVAKIIMDYCVSHANDSRNLAFLSPFFGALRQCMEIFPEEAYDRLSGIAYIPVMHRSYILNFSTIARPPQLRMVFWERCSKPLRKMTDPIFQLDVERATARGPDDNRFTRQIFVASFDALWCYKDERKSLKSNPDSLAAVQVTETTTWWRYLSQQVTEKTTWWRNRFLQVTEKTTWWRIRFPQVTEKTAWWRILFQIWLKTHIKTHNYVETHDFSIEFYDNPAIAALVSYKWNTIGYWYWFTRYVFQCCFYLLVLTAALMQVYYPMPSRLVGVFIAIIFMALNFLWLEFVQARRSPRCYTK